MNQPRVSDLVIAAAAGVVGTVAMDMLRWLRARQAGSDDGFVDWAFATGSDYDSFDDVPAPGLVGQRITRLVGVDLAIEHSGLTTDVVHWATGLSWGTAAGALTAVAPIAAFPAGIASGVAAIGTAYGALGAAGIYQPVWEYDRATLWKDASAHLVFGTAAGLTLWAMRKLRST
ncbi:hypothetical protein BH23ACT5_BH23ACT5_08430 [soil metagenome]